MKKMKARFKKMILFALLAALTQACSVDATLEELVQTPPVVPVATPPVAPTPSASPRPLQKSLGSSFQVVEQGQTVSTGYSMHMIITPSEKKEISGGGYTIKIQ